VYTTLSYHALETEDGCYGEELLRDKGSDVETECFARFDREAVRAALAQLSEEEQRLIEYLYLSKKPGTVRGYEDLTGISKSAANRRQIAALVKLKNFLSE
jgi:DNA-directed RNA polymerase specialized sigma subunit